MNRRHTLIYTNHGCEHDAYVFHISGLVQERCNSIANVLELHAFFHVSLYASLGHVSMA